MIDDGSFMNEFKTFRAAFEARIKKDNITYYDNDCYLIENRWYNELEKNVKISEINKNRVYSRNISNSKLSFPKGAPIFINEINKAIEYLKSNNNPQLISTKLMSRIIKNEDLKNKKVVKYFPGFNNLIIIFLGNEYNNGLFLFNPLDKNDKKNILFSFKIKNRNIEENVQIYSELLQMGTNLNKTLIDNLIKMNKISHYKIIENNEEISYESAEYVNSTKDILRILISIFYYENSLELNINEIFPYSPIRKFNLINHDWINNFKKNFNYEDLYNLLSNCSKWNKIDYFNYDEYMNDIFLYAKNNINIKKKEFPEKFLKTDLMKPQIISIKNIFYYDKSYIMPFEIMESIEKFLFTDKKISIKPNMIFSRNNNIYLIDSIKILYGNINEQLLFIPEYIFSYNNITNLNKEKELINSIPITQYIKQKKCNQNNNSYIQRLNDEYSNEIGDFINLKIKLNNNSKIDNITIKNKREIEVNTIKNNSLNKRNIPNIKNKEGNRELASNYKKKRPNLNMSCINNYNYNNQIEKSDEEDEIQKSEKSCDKEKYIYKRQKVSSTKTQQQTIEEAKNDLKNEILLNELKEKIEELEKDNQNKEKELNNYKDILKKKDKNIQNMENELEELSKENDDNIQEKDKLLSELEINKNDIINKEKEINQLKVENKNKKEEYEKLKSKTEKEIDEFKINLEKKENELLKYKEKIKNYEDKETKLKKLEDIEVEIKNKNKEMENIKNKYNETINSNNELIKKNKKLEEEINKKNEEYEKILILIDNKNKDKDDINNKYEELNKNYLNLINQVKNKEEEIQKNEEKKNSIEKEY